MHLRRLRAKIDGKADGKVCTAKERIGKLKLNEKAIVFVPDGTAEEAAFSRVTHLAVSAHQDDIEFMAYAPIAECFGREDKWFGAVVTTDGAGSPRSGLYADFTDEDMKRIRIGEQKKAAYVGEYACRYCWGILRGRRKIRRIRRSSKNSCRSFVRRALGMCTCTTLRTSTTRTWGRH